MMNLTLDMYQTLGVGILALILGNFFKKENKNI